MSKQKAITVFGSAQPLSGERLYQQAYTLGADLAYAGYTVISGGYGGIMAAVSEGAVSQGGTAIGITVSHWNAASGNKFLSQCIPTSSLSERLDVLLKRGDGYCFLPGGTGTLLELAMVWEFVHKRIIIKKPMCCFGDFWAPLIKRMHSLPREIAKPVPRMLILPDSAAIIRYFQQVFKT